MKSLVTGMNRNGLSEISMDDSRAMAALAIIRDSSVSSDPHPGLDAICEELGLRDHGVRFRTTGYRQLIEAHLLIPHTMKLGQAHRRATRLEECLTIDLEIPSKVTTHLESLQDHFELHCVQQYRVRAVGSPQTILQSARKVTAKVQPRSVRSKERSPPKLFINARET